MKILPINIMQNNKQQNFKARFRQQDIKEFLREIEGGDVDIVPKLYTMLDIIKKQSGKSARIQHLGLWNRILIDGKSLNGDTKQFNAFHALLESTVKLKDTLLQDSPIKRLSEEEFENAYYKNSKKTVKDIENIFKE